MMQRILQFLVLVFLVWLGVGQGRAADDAAGWGTVKGQTVWAGGPIPPLLLASTTGNKDEAFCLSKGPIHKEEWVISPKSNGTARLIL